MMRPLAGIVGAQPVRAPRSLPAQRRSPGATTAPVGLPMPPSTAEVKRQTDWYRVVVGLGLEEDTNRASRAPPSQSGEIVPFTLMPVAGAV